MSSDILAKLFGSSSRVKIIRLFLLNPDEIFTLKEISQRAKATKEAGRREISVLRGAGLVRPKSGYVATAGDKKKKIQGWKLNESFPLIANLNNFVLNAAPISRPLLLKKLQKTGRIKLVILSGIFGKGEEGRVDIFVVGDGIKKGKLESIIRDIEAELGKELQYAALSTEDFSYRLGMYDKFVRDILDYPHEKILDKLGL